MQNQDVKNVNRNYLLVSFYLNCLMYSNVYAFVSFAFSVFLQPG